MSRFGPGKIEAIYATHPLRKDTIVRRLLKQRGSLDRLTEPDLAEDSVTGISDQNHMGGLASTLELAARARISRASHVLDLGCGLGGPARALAWRYGCRVHGLDLSPQRIRDAGELTALVGLAHLVSFECVNMMTAPLPKQRFDVLWGQGAWSHLEDKSAFLQKWTKALSAHGCVAVEDACRRRQPADDRERDLIASVEEHWASALIQVEGPGGWRRLLEDCGLDVLVAEDRSDALLPHFRELHAGSERLEEPVSDFEKRAWDLAIEAAEASLIGHFRIVAERAGP